MDDQLLAAFDEWMTGQWTAIHAEELQVGDKMRDAQGGTAEISGIYPSADGCVFVNAKGRWGVHIPKERIVLIKP